MKSLHQICLVMVVYLLLSFDHDALAQQFAQTRRLKTLSLEQLLEIEVLSASRKPQLYSQAAGAISVMTGERIRRTGATTLPDILRVAPGIHVLNSDSRSWGVSARGLNLNTANKMQVLMDGRTLYTPLFGGVFWDVQDYVLQDVERIEVIQGPNATLWGGNAMNGVINIMTLSAQDTQGGVFEVRTGNEEHATVAARYGSKFGEGVYYRGYFKFFDRDGMVLANGQDAQDDWQSGRGGFRIDTDLTQTSTLSIHGDAYRNDLTFPDRDNATLSGGNIVAQWNRLFKGNSDFTLVAYYDRSDRKIPEQFQEKRNTFAVDLQHRFQPLNRHDFVWGVNYHASADETEDIGTIQFDPQDRTIHHLSAFVQDDIAVVPEKLVLVLGTKIEDNTLSNLEVQPNVRIAWMPDPGHTLWGAVARAVRVPSRLDTDLRFFPVPGFLAVEGNPDFKPEEVIGVEGGYRMTPYKAFFLDVSAFHHSYDSLITLEPGAPGEPSTIGNGMNADIIGATFSANYEPKGWIRAVGSITLLDKELEPDPNSNDISNASGEGNDPNHYWFIHVMTDPIERLQLDMILRSSGELPSPVVPGYVTMDLRLSFQVSERFDLALIGRNLFHESTPEFGAPLPTRHEVERSIYGQASWYF